MKRRAAIALVALMATACGVQPSGVISGNEAPSGPAVPSVAKSRNTIYFIAGGTLTPVRRTGEDLTGAAAINALAQGPTPAEQAKNLSTQVPRSALPASVYPVADGTVVQLSDSVIELSVLAERQIVCTLANQTEQGTRFILTGGGQTLPAQVCQ
ncbi:MAG TPA: hypothetical protein VG674_04690 [Amycolatopsis sp.]|nr:hypothetical protein [Amycolatopsis sp.]